nr:MAG TPA: hypothetical protein [Caudoviricetes sp.]
MVTAIKNIVELKSPSMNLTNLMRETELTSM